MLTFMKPKFFRFPYDILKKNWVFERVEAGKQALYSLSFKTSTTCGVLPFKTGSFLKWVPPFEKHSKMCLSIPYRNVSVLLGAQ